MSLTELMEVEISSLAKRPQTWFEVPASAYVITDEEIRRSGATTIPDALRLVPGLQVASYNAHTWAVSIRGFNDIFAHNLLVLLDGRTVYSWTTTGTIWYRVDTPLITIDRIEVIRGPGGTIWGANAVNGVINIVTKAADEDPGWRVFAGAGTLERHLLEATYSDDIGDSGPDYRVYVKSRDRGPFEDVWTDDSWRSQQAGFRLDGDAGGGARYSLQGDVASAEIGEAWWVPPTPHDAYYRGFDLLGEWRLDQDDGRWRVKAYYDQFSREVPVVEHVRVFDVEANHLWRGLANHEVLWGVGARWMSSDIQGRYGVSFADPDRSAWLFSAFAQDEFRFADDWRLTYGTKVEKNGNVESTEWQPSVRLTWLADDDTMLWGAVSRAVRNPARLEQEMRLSIPLDPNTSGGLSEFRFSGNPHAQSEELIAYELGGRRRVSDNLRLDASLFQYNYDDLLWRQEQVVQESGTFILNSVPYNTVQERIQGLELLASWLDGPWTLQGGYSQMISRDNKERATPNHQATVRVGYKPTQRFEADLFARYSGRLWGFEIPVHLASPSDEIDPYVGLDLRLAWRLRRNVEVALIGRDLLQPDHLDYDSRGGDTLVGLLPRSVMATVDMTFD